MSLVTPEALPTSLEVPVDNLFETPPAPLFENPVNVPDPTQDPEDIRRTAQMAVLAGASEEAEGIFASLDSQVEIISREIELVGESSVRRQIAADRNARRMRDVEGVIKDNLPNGDPELVQGATIAYANLAQLDAAEEEAYAMEQEAVRRVQELAASGDITQSRIMLSNLEHGNALDVIQDYSAKQQILETALRRAQFDVENQSWMRHAVDFILAAVPLYSPSRTGNVPIADHVKNWYDSFFAGERFRNEADALWDMPISEFSRFVNTDFIENIYENTTLLGYTNQTERLELLTGLVSRTPSAFETNAWSAVDIGGFVPWTQAFKLGGAIPSMMVRAGARREAAELTARAALDIIQDSSAAAGRSGMTADNVANNLKVSAIADEGLPSRIPLAVDTGAIIRRSRELLARLPELEQTSRLAPNEMEDALRVVTERLERQYGQPIKDVIPSYETLSDNSRVSRVTFVLGRKEGGGFADEVQANQYLGSIGETGLAIQDESGQWFAQMTHDLPEAGFMSNLLNVKTPSPARFLLSARNIGDIDLSNAAMVAGNKRNKMLKTLVEPYSNVFRSLRGNESEAVRQVLQAGESLGTWFNKDQIETLYQRRWNRAPNERELRAYQAARDINDIEWTLRNEAMHKERLLKGYRSVTMDTGIGVIDRANALIDFELKSAIKGRVYDVSLGRHYVDGVDAAKLARMRNQGYRLVTLEAPMRLDDGTTIRAFLAKGKDMVADNLQLEQVPYRAGGHRMYNGKYFVKQAVRGVQPDTGREFLDTPNTYIAAATRAEADFWARRMEAARLAHLDGADLGVLDDILGGHAGLPSAKEFVRLMDDASGPFQRDTPFKTYYDREMPEEYLRTSEGVEFLEPDDSGFNGLMRTQGRMYTGRKGEHLPDYMGERAPLLDPFETINRSLMNISSLSSFNDYKLQAVERWMKTFGRYLDVRPGDGLADASDLRKFMEAPLIKGGNDEIERIRSAALAQRQIIKRVLGWQTDNDIRAAQWGRHLNEWVQGTRVDGALPDARKALTLWTQDKNPISALRSFAFDLKLGLFNFAQLPMQISTTWAAIALSPKLGAQGAALIPAMRFILGGRALTREALESRMDELVRRGVHKIGGFETGKDFKEFARAAVRSGFFDLGGTHGLMDHYGPGAALDGFASGTKRVREAGRFFFFEAERWNRIAAWRIAWDEARATGLKTNSPEFAAKLQGRAEEYAFNMSRESQAWWQQGLLSIPTQFWAYNARMLEAMTVGNFTPAQKLRLALSQTLLYGSAGLPITGFISEMIKKDSGEAPDIESFWGTADRGLIDRLIYETTGVDALVGDRYGTGNWMSDVVRNVFGMSQYGEVSAAEIMGGATFGIMSQFGTDVLKPIVEYMTAESGDTGRALNREGLLRLASNVSSISNVLKAHLVWKYGTYRSNSGNTLLNDLPPSAAFAVALGIQPGEMDQLSAQSGYMQNRSEAIREAAKVVTNYRVDMLNRPDQRETIMEEVNTFVRLLPDDIRADVLNRADGDVDPSLYVGLTERYQQQKAKEERINGSAN